MARGLNLMTQPNDTVVRGSRWRLDRAVRAGCGKYIREASEHIGGEVSGVHKFTPSPADRSSVVEACAMSRERLAVDAIDLTRFTRPTSCSPSRASV